MNASSVPTRVPPERAPDRPTSATRPARGTRESRGGFDRMLRVGDRLVPVAADPETGAARLGGNVVVADVRVASAEVAEADGERIVRGWLEGPVDAPFVRGVARFEVADGTITGRVRVRADVGVLGAVVTQLAYEAHTDDGLPLPAVAVGEDGVHVELDGRLEDGALVAETPAAAMEADEKATDVASRARARSQGAPLPPGVRDQLALLLGEAPADVVLHTDKAAADATAALGADALVDDPDVYVAPDRWKPETAEGLDLLVRAVTQALARVSGPVLPASELVDPSEPSAEPQPRPAVTAPQPPRPAPGAGPTPRPEPGPWMALREEPAAEAPEPQEAVVGDLAALAPEERAPEVADGDGVALLMPPAPAEPTPAAQARASGVRSRARTAATSARELPPAEALTGAAREAVTEPPEETVARAEAAITDVLGDRPPPSPAVVALASEIRIAIRAKRPIDEKDLVKADPDEMAREAGASLNAAVEGEAAQVQGSYDELNEVTPGAPSQVGAPLTPHVPGFADSGIDATQGVPDLIPDEDLSLDADRDAIQQRIDEAEIERDTTEPINEPPFSTVRAGSEELDELAQEGPAEIAARQDAALAQASADLAALQAQAMAALAQSRTSAVSDVDQRQGTMVGDEGRTREAISAEASRIFTDAQMRVNTMLDPLTRTAMAKWDAGVQRHATTFRQTLRRVEEWIKERHSGVGGFFVKGWDRLTGLPRWVTREYDRAERRFGDDVSALLLEISSDVNAVIVAAEAVIDDARERIDRLFDDLPVELQAWAEDQRAAFHQRLDGLQHRVTQTRDGFERDLARSALSTVNEVRAEVEALREQARGLIGQIADAIEAFLDDPVRAIIDGLLRLVGIPPLAFWALVERIKQVISDIADDPINFVSNLLAAVGQGFERFFDSFPSHLLKGFFDWLFSGLGSVGVQIPRDLSLKSLITFALQLMGITWPRIREILVRHIGEENVALIEQAWQLVMTLVQQGPEGIFEMIKDRLDPQTLLQMVLDAAIDYIVETLVAQAVRWLASLLTPAGAIVKAIEVIYQVLRWTFQNAARIFRFVETIVNGMADIVAGRIGPMAEAVEKALASLLVVVIDFLMGLVGLGDLPDKVVSVIKGLQARVHEILERIIAWLVERGRALLTALGLREEGEEEAAEPAVAEDLKLGTTVTFAAVGNTHRHWVDVTSTDATLMVASDARPVPANLQDWRGRLDGVHEDQRGNAAKLLDRAESLHNEADITADQLVEAIRRAQASGGTEEAPTDEAVESAQHRLAGILRQLFEIFDGVDAQAKLDEIAKHLPTQGQKFTGTVHETWKKRISVVVEHTSRERVWEDDVFAGTEVAALDYLRAGETHNVLLPWFFVKGERLAEKDPFARYVFRERSPDPRHLVRPGFLTTLGDQAAEKLRDEGTKRVPLERNDELHRTIAAIGFDWTQWYYGWFTSWPSDDVWPALRDAVRQFGSGGILRFMAAMVRAGRVGEISWDEFQRTWARGGTNVLWLKEEFRSAAPGNHEWIPTDWLPRVMARAVDIARADAARIDQALQWLTVFHYLRSPSNEVLWNLRGGEVGALPIPVGAHAGALYEERAGQDVPTGTVGSERFHNLLRDAFDAAEGQSALQFVRQLKAKVRAELWSGVLTESQRGIADQPLGIRYRVDRREYKSWTLRQLADQQRQNVERAMTLFDNVAEMLRG